MANLWDILSRADLEKRLTTWGKQAQGGDTRTFQQYDKNNATAQKQIGSSAFGVALPNNPYRAEAEQAMVNNTAQVFADPTNFMMAGQITPKYAKTLQASDNPIIKRVLEMQGKIDDAVAGGRTEFAQNPKKPWYESNAEYKVSSDPDLLCQRSAGCDTAVNKVKKELGADYNSNMAYQIADDALKGGLEAPCPTCYVYNGRAKSGTAMQKKFMEGEGGYSGDLLRLRPESVDQLPGGALRNYASTDAKPTHIPGQIMEALDSAKRGIPEGSYTKEGWYADVFGPSGQSINMSIGRDSRIGMDRATADAARAKYPNVGTTYVAMSDAEIRAAKADAGVDHVIPFHASGKPIDQVRADYKDPTINDYTGMQNELITHPKTNTLVKPDASVKIKDKEHGGDINKYLGIAQDRNLIPKFAPFIFENPAQVKVVEDLLEKIKLQKKTDTSELFAFINQHQKEIDPNYMKLIGPEYGKHGGTVPPPLADPTKIDLDAAEGYLSKYLSDPDSVVKNKAAYEALADLIINNARKGGK